MRNGDGKSLCDEALEEMGKIEVRIRELTERLGTLRLVVVREMSAGALGGSTFRETNQEEIIMEAVCARFKVSRAAMVGPDKVEHNVWARFVAMVFIRRLLGRSSARTAQIFGDRDHATALNACKRVDDRIDTDRCFAAEFVAVQNQLITILSRGTKTDGAAGSSSHAPSIPTQTRAAGEARPTQHCRHD